MTEPQIPTDCWAGGRPRCVGSYPPGNRSRGPSTSTWAFSSRASGTTCRPATRSSPNLSAYASPRALRAGRLIRLGRRADGTGLATTLSQVAAVVARQAKPTRSQKTASGLEGS